MDERYKDENHLEKTEEMENLLDETNRTLKDDAEDVLDSAGEAVDNVIDSVSEKASDLFSGVAGLATGAVDAVKNTGADIADGVVNAAEGVVSTAGDVGSNVVESAKDFGSGVVETVKDSGSDVVDSGTEIVTGAVVAAGAVAGSLLGGAKKLGEDAIDGVKSVAESTTESVENTINSVHQTGTDAVKTVNENLQETSSLVDGDIPAVLRPKDIFKAEDEAIDARIAPANERISSILNALKENNFSKDYGIIMYLVAFGLVLAVVFQFIQLGLTARVVSLVLLGVFFLIYRGAVKGITRDVFDLKAKVQRGGKSPVEDVLGKINYVVSGIDLNLKRISYTKWLCILFSPLLVFACLEIWKGSFSASTNFWLLMIGYITSFITIPMLFKGDANKLESLELELNDIRREFY